MNNAERAKSIVVAINPYIQTALLLCALAAAIIGVYALWTWKDTNRMVGATNARLDGVLSKLESKIDAVDTARVNGVLDATTARITALQAQQDELTAFIDAMTRNGDRAVNALVARADQARTNLDSLRAVTDNTAVFTAHLDAATTGPTGTLPRLNALLQTTDVQVAKLGGDGSLLITTINDEAAALLDKLTALTVTADGAIAAYRPVGVNLAGITSDLHAMTTDSAARWHALLYPPHVTGFWPNVKRVASYIYRPAFDGVRLYYTLQSLPVHLTAPLPK